MKKDNYMKAIDDLKISEDFKEKTRKLMYEARDTHTKENKIMNRKLVVTLASAAVVLTIGVIGVNQGNLFSSDSNTTDKGETEYSVLSTESGITIPKIKIGNSNSGKNADMIALFVYNGRVYTQSNTTLLNIDGIVDKETINSLKGDYLGKTKSGINEFSEDEAYKENFISNIGESEIYTVKGYDSNYRLMVYTEYSDGYDCQIYDSFGGLTVMTGADYFNKLQIKDNVTSITWENYDSWNNGLSNISEAKVDKIFNNFMNALYDSIPIGEKTDMFTENTEIDSQKFVKVTTKDNLTTTLRLFKDGFVYANGVGFFEVDKVTFDAFYQSLPVDQDKTTDNTIDIKDTDLNNSDSPSNVNQSLKVYTKKSSYKVGVKTITLELVNTSKEELYYGMDFSIEKLTGDTWEVVPGVENLMFIEIAKLLPGDSKEEFEINLTDLGKNMKAGKYRIVKNLNNSVYYAEFELTK